MFNKLYVKIKNIIKENYIFIIIFILMFLLFNIELPYKIQTPGGFLSLKEKIKVNNEYNDDGEFGMAYVSEIKGSIPFLLYSYLNPNWDIISNDELSYENETIEDVFNRGVIKMKEAIFNATYNAYKKSGNEINILDKKIYITYIDNIENDFKVGDEIISINDYHASSLEELNEIIASLDHNNTVYVKVKRYDKEKIIEAHLKEYNNIYKLGLLLTYNYEYEANPTINVSSKTNESGPSGGLMMALDIYNKLTNSNLTKSEKIAGTGTIDLNGNVGEISGIKYKLIGAYESGAKVFLCPKENYEEAYDIAQSKNYDIIIKDVGTLDEAITFLKER